VATNVRALWARWRDLGDDVDGYATRRSHPTAVVVQEPRSADGPGYASGGRSRAERADHREDHELEDRPADQGDDRRDVQDGASGVERIGPQDAFEWRHEELACIEDPRHEGVARGASINNRAIRSTMSSWMMPNTSTVIRSASEPSEELVVVRRSTMVSREGSYAGSV